MADKRSLGLCGLLFGVVTGAVMLVAAVTVQAHIGNGPDAASAAVAATVPTR